MPSPGQEFSHFQRGLINRYYENIDTIALQRLGEIVSDLYLAEGSKATKLWSSARQAMAKLAPADDPHVMKVLSVRSVAGLAKLVTELQSGSRPAMQKSSASSVAPTDPVVGDTPMINPATHPTRSTAPVAHAPTMTPPAAGAPPTPDELKHAMKAFRKRLKLTRLDEESKLGRVGNPMSGGRKSQIQAIMPPREYSKAVWDELVKQGKLKSAGGSFYELIEGA